MKMIDTKGKKEGFNGSPYSYGMSITFNKEMIKKVGLEPDDLCVGCEVDFKICAEVTDVNKTAGSKEIDSCTMQIVKIGKIEESEDMDSKSQRKNKVQSMMNINGMMGGRIKE